MKRQSLLFISFVLFATSIYADVQNLKWSRVSTHMEEAWYGTNEAKAIAENVLIYQKNSGGWGKNIEMHKSLSEEQKQIVKSKKTERSCFDNGATTMEMRFLAKVYKHVKDERYREAFNKALNCIIKAQYNGGGWPQYYPLRGGYSDNITFNDDLHVNLMKVMWDVYQGKGEFASITDEATREKAKQVYDKGLQCILDCQIDDCGKKSVWCAQHDPYTLDPAFGRPHEHPSFSGSEGARVLDFLMTIEQPSQEVKDAVVAGADWFLKHYIADKKVQDVKVNGKTVDREIVNAKGQYMWGRFIQLAGETATRVYNGMIKELSNNRRDVRSEDGKTYRYYCSDHVKDSWDPEKEYAFLYGIYDSNTQQLYYRFLYNYADTDPLLDKNNVKIETSLRASNRTGYQYLGNWPTKTVMTNYPNWKKKHNVTSDIQNIKQEKTPGKVYSINGMLIADTVTPETLAALPPGLYIVSGKKYVVM